MSRHSASTRGHTHRVRPRWTWIALLAMLTGLVLIAIGIVAETWAWAIPGLVVLVIGGVAAVYGGFFYDVQGGTSIREHVHDVVEGREFDFPGAGTKRSEAEVKDDVHRRWLSDGE
jgi:predicted membrane channel-forming protein YqfA (hemolysin III family)